LKKVHYILLVFCFSSISFSRTNVQEKEGTVTFISSQYFYVRFENTDGIKQGDTLFVRTEKKLLPVLDVQFISSKSIAGILVGKRKVQIGDKLIAIVSEETEEDKTKEPEMVKKTVQPFHEILPDVNYQKTIDKKKPEISARLSVQSYSSLSNNSRSIDYQRWRYTLSFNANRICSSDLSFSSYMNFNYKANDWNAISSNLWRSLKIYDLALKYNFNESSSLVVGRNRNRNISNIGSVDGIQFEKRFNSFYAGAVVGYRPDFSDLGFNSKLFEFGGYVGRTDTLGVGSMENNLAFMQQTNTFKTDRRFIYFQHSNNILENTYFFVSSEVDLYKKILNIETNEFILTSVFFSVRYSPSPIFSTTISYDARKNVVYYETYKNFIDSLFENETRQGLNLRANFRLINKLFFGLSGGYRFKKGDIKPTRNFGTYLTYSQIPFIESSVAVNYNRLFTNFVESSIVGIRLTKYLFNNSTGFSFSYRISDYKLTSLALISTQNIFSVDLSTRFNRVISFSISYEGIFEKKTTTGRIFAGLTTRF
jgi:hypothetical protein